LLSCWPVLPGAPQIRGLPRQSQLPVFFLSYAENERKKRRADILRSNSLNQSDRTTQPHALSA